MSRLEAGGREEHEGHSTFIPFMKVDGTTLSPRLPIASVPYALRAGTAAVADSARTAATAAVAGAVGPFGGPSGALASEIVVRAMSRCGTCFLTANPSTPGRSSIQSG